MASPCQPARGAAHHPASDPVQPVCAGPAEAEVARTVLLAGVRAGSGGLRLQPDSVAAVSSPPRPGRAETPSGGREDLRRSRAGQRPPPRPARGAGWAGGSGSGRAFPGWGLTLAPIRRPRWVIDGVSDDVAKLARGADRAFLRAARRPLPAGEREPRPSVRQRRQDRVVPRWRPHAPGHGRPSRFAHARTWV